MAVPAPQRAAQNIVTEHRAVELTFTPGQTHVEKPTTIEVGTGMETRRKHRNKHSSKRHEHRRGHQDAGMPRVPSRKLVEVPITTDVSTQMASRRKHRDDSSSKHR